MEKQAIKRKLFKLKNAKVFVALLTVLLTSVFFISLMPTVKGVAPSIRDGFEDNDFSDWTVLSSSGTETINSTFAYDGTYSFSGSVDVAGARYSLIYKANVYSETEIYASCYVYFAGSVAQAAGYSNRFLGLLDYPTQLLDATYFESSGNLYWSLVYRNNSAVLRTNNVTASQPVANQWYYVEVWGNCSTANGVYDGGCSMWVYNATDGTEVATLSVTGLDTDITVTDTILVGRGRTPTCATGQSISVGINLIDNVVVSTAWIEQDISFADDLESGDFSAWDATATGDGSDDVSINTTIYYDGSNSARCYWDGTFQDFAQLRYYVESVPTELYTEAYVYAELLPDWNDTYGVGVITYYNKTGTGSSQLAYAKIAYSDAVGDYTWAVGCRDGSSYAWAYNDTMTVSLNTWYSVQLYWLMNATAGIARCYVDGVLVAELTGKDTADYDEVARISYGGATVNLAESPATYCAGADCNGTIFIDKVTVSSSFITYTGNTAPSNDGCTVTNLDDTDNVYAQYRNYIATYNGSDTDGYADVVTVDLTIQTGGATERITFRYTEDTDTFSEQSGSTTAWNLVTGSCVSTRAGNDVDLEFHFMAEWSATEEADLDIKAVITDDDSATDTDTYDLNFDVVTNLVVSGFACDDDRGDVSQTITFTGTVYYVDDPSSSSASSAYPPDAEFTSVSIYDDWNNNEGSDSSVTNGAFSVAFTSNSTVGLETYNPFINMVDATYTDAEESPTDTYIGDSLTIAITVDDNRVNINTNATIGVSATYDYDSSAYDGSLTLNHTTYSYATAQRQGYTVSSAGGDDSYGVTVIGTNDVDYVIWDNIGVTFSVDSASLSANNTATFTVAMAFDYDSVAVSSYNYTVTRNGTSYNSPHTSGTFTDRQTNTVYVYNFTGVTDDTYGITSFTLPSTITVTWGAGTYTVVLSASGTSLTVGTAVVINIAVTRDGVTVTNYKLNVTKTNDLYMENMTDTFFTYASNDASTQTFNVTGIYDVDTDLAATPICAGVSVTWNINIPSSYSSTPPPSSEDNPTEPTPLPTSTPEDTDWTPIEIPDVNLNEIAVGVVVVICAVSVVVAKEQGLLGGKKKTLNQKSKPKMPTLKPNSKRKKPPKMKKK